MTKRNGPLERVIVSKVMDTARSLGWYPIKIHGNAFQLAGLPDVLVLKGGRAAWMEAKRPGQSPSVIQKRRIGELTATGCPVAVVFSAADAKKFLEALA
jgi:hypothetical protein